MNTTKKGARVAIWAFAILATIAFTCAGTIVAFTIFGETPATAVDTVDYSAENNMLDWTEDAIADDDIDTAPIVATTLANLTLPEIPTETVIEETIQSEIAPEYVATETPSNEIAEPQNVVPTQLFSTIQIGQAYIPYVNSYLSTVCPEHTAGLWYGSDSTTDFSYGYYIGHNPGIFSPVLTLGFGDSVTVWDTNGNVATYHVVDIFDVPNTYTLGETLPRIEGYGESIAMQTCINGGEQYRVVVAAI